MGGQELRPTGKQRGYKNAAHRAGLNNFGGLPAIGSIAQGASATTLFQ